MKAKPTKCCLGVCIVLEKKERVARLCIIPGQQWQDWQGYCSDDGSGKIIILIVAVVKVARILF